MNDRQCSIAIGAEHELSLRIKPDRIHTLADRQTSHHFSSIDVHDNHHLIEATDEIV